MESPQRKFGPPLVGRTHSLPDETLFLLDESLDPAVADALRSVGYNFTTVPIAFQERRGVSDREIIEWASANNAVWAHADDRARKQHGILIITWNIRTLWVYRPRGKMTSAEQLRILAYVLPDLLDRYQQHPSRRHYKADAIGNPPRTRIRLQHYEL